MNKIIAASAMAIIMTIAVSSYSDAIQNDLESGIIRLHVIADSDSDADQEIKLMVRDAIIEKMSGKLKEGNIEQNREIIINSLDEIEKTADEVLMKNGFAYTAAAEYGRFEFPRKSYSSVTLPAGEYYGVRVRLGRASGQNWWCVMYPPMCFDSDSGGKMSDESDSKLRGELESETYDVITGSGDAVEIRFGIVELVHKAKRLLSW